MSPLLLFGGLFILLWAIDGSVLTAMFAGIHLLVRGHDPFLQGHAFGIIDRTNGDGDVDLLALELEFFLLDSLSSGL